MDVSVQHFRLSPRGGVETTFTQFYGDFMSVHTDNSKEVMGCELAPDMQLNLNVRGLPPSATLANKYRVVLLSDEIYGKLHHEGEHHSIVPLYPEGTIFSGGLRMVRCRRLAFGGLCFPKVSPVASGCNGRCRQ